MKLKIILFNLSIIIFLICLIYLYIYVNYKYEGFADPTPPVAGSSGEVFRPEGATQNPITDKTTESNVLNEGATIAKINPTLSELEKAGVSPETAISARVMPYFNVGRAATNKPALSDGYYWVDYSDTNLTGALTSHAGATLNEIAGSKDQYLLYNSSGSLVLREDYVCDILVVGGGGGGSTRTGGGGGAGALIYKKNYTLKAGSYNITIGAGGKGATGLFTPAGKSIGSGYPTEYTGKNGEDTIITYNNTTIFTAKGGGGGGHAENNGLGNIGGCNGGNGSTITIAQQSVNKNNIPQDSDSFGNKGGIGVSGNNYHMGAPGGGGAGGEGLSPIVTSITLKGGDGGIGKQISITGKDIYYCGGGGGGIYGSSSINAPPGNGGLGGGGAGGRTGRGTKAENGTPNTGGGGGGGGFSNGSRIDNNDDNQQGGDGGSGVVIIRIKERGSLGKKFTYCVMNKNYFGGGWMLAMRAVRGSKTFGYNSEHWTNATTLNDTIEKIREVSFDADLNVSSIGNAIFNNYDGNNTEINRYDAKFDIFNRYKANEWMAIFYFKNDYGVVLKGGDLISGGNQTAKGWIWRETNLIEADKIERTPLQLFQKRNRMDRNYSLIDLRGNYGVNNVKNLDKFKPASGMPQLWSSQHGYNFYGINYDVPEWYEYANARGASTRWGFAWNENWDYANNNLTNDVYGGIGLRFPGAGQPGYSAGDFIYCCHDSRGANSSIAFEWYVR